MLLSSDDDNASGHFSSLMDLVSLTTASNQSRPALTRLAQRLRENENALRKVASELPWRWSLKGFGRVAPGPSSWGPSHPLCYALHTAICFGLQAQLCLYIFTPSRPLSCFIVLPNSSLHFIFPNSVFFNGNATGLLKRDYCLLCRTRHSSLNTSSVFLMLL